MNDASTQPQSPTVLLRHPAGWLASGFGSGFSPRAPGTVGTIVALLPWLWLRTLPLPLYAIAIVVSFAVGVWVSTWVVRRSGIQDPQVVVWDEFVGVWIALAAAPTGWIWMLAGFALFRLFDIWKPWPVRWADEKLHGGLGVMLDDVFAGIYALIVMQLAELFLR
jgi:phosphatidylglycerophosphatase A